MNELLDKIKSMKKTTLALICSAMVVNVGTEQVPVWRYVHHVIKRS